MTRKHPEATFLPKFRRVSCWYSLMTVGLCLSTLHQTKADDVSWALGGDGYWDVAANWSRREAQDTGLYYYAIPGAADTAHISNATVFVSYGPYTVGGLNMTNAGLSSGSLNVLGGVSLSGSNTFTSVGLTVGGSFYAESATFNGSNITLSSPTASMAGNVTFGNQGGGLYFLGNSAQGGSNPVYTLSSALTMSGYIEGIGNYGRTYAGTDAASLISAATINLNNTYTTIGAKNEGVTNFTNNGAISETNNSQLNINTATFTNNGSLQANSGSTVQINSNTFTNTGTLTAAKGTTISFSFSPTQTAGHTVVDGNLSMSAGQTFNLQGGVISGSGTISNYSYYGTISVDNTGGIVRPGDSPGTLTLKGNYEQGSGGTLDIGLGSASAYDVFDVTGAVTLDGTLDVFMLDGYTPTVGETFTFFDYGSLTGRFSHLISDGNELGYSISYGNQSAMLTITSVSTPEPGVWALLSGLGVSGAALLRRRRRTGIGL